MHDLGQVRAHAFAHPGRQHHDIQNDCFVGQEPILGRVKGGTAGEQRGNSRGTAGEQQAAILTAQAHGPRAVLTIRRSVGEGQAEAGGSVMRLDSG
jgi:hypothetical protein